MSASPMSSQNHHADAFVFAKKDAERKVALEIDCHGTVPVSVAFSVDGRQVVSGECSSNLARGKLRRWYIKDGREAGAAVDVTNGVHGIAVSQDGQWRVSIEGRGAVVRNTANKRMITVGDHRDAASRVYVVDVSPDSTKFASGSGDGTVRIFSITNGQRLLGPLRHDNKVYGVKFSPSGDRLATAALGDGLANLTPGSVRIWDTSSGSKLVDVSINKIFTPCTPFAWTTDSHLFVVASSHISQIHVPTAKVHSGWSLPADFNVSYCSLATNGRFVVCVDDGRITFWDPASLTRIGPTISQFPGVVRSIALSPDGHYLACGRMDEKIVLYALRDVLPLYHFLDVSTSVACPASPISRLHTGPKPVFHLPLIKVDTDSFRTWIEDNLVGADACLAKDPASGLVSRHHVLASRALVRARRKLWDAALGAAEEVTSSPSFQPASLFTLSYPLRRFFPVPRYSAIGGTPHCKGPRAHRPRRVRTRAPIF